MLEMFNNSNWKWTEDAFQAIAYWLGYQRKRFRHYPIREIAVATELAALLHAPAQRQGLRIECERTFPLVLDVPPGSIPDDQQKRVDIAITPEKGPARYAIEVKVVDRIVCSASQLWVGDLKRLALLQQQNTSLAVRLALVTESSLPAAWLTDSGRAIRREQVLNDGFSFQIRRIFRALPLLPSVDVEKGRVSLNRGPCVVLIEPSCERRLLSESAST
jgi:hypothetical protein